MRTVVHCPCCEGRAKVQTSTVLSPSLSKHYCACRDPFCGCTFVAHFETVYILSPSGKPNSAVQLPMSARAWAHKQKQAESD